ncbi:peptide transporter family 1-like isoform X4 [Crassostrea virginica]
MMTVLSDSEDEFHAEEDSSLIQGETSSKDPNGQINGKSWGRVKTSVTRSQKYPKSVYFILGNEFCERFSYYGMRAVLILYLTNWLGFSEDVGTAIFHSFVMLCYLSPLIGAVLADGYLGRYKTILIVSLVYAAGNLVMAITALPPPEWYGPAVGLILIGLGTGGIKPNVSSFGADQFRADQEKERYTFFSAFYFAINLGSMLSIVLTPILRADVKCYGNECYPLAFGIPAALMVLATIIFIAGSSLYKKVPPSGNLIGRVFKCIWGVFGTIKPDQMSAINPLLILLLIPIFEKFIYPCLEKCKCLHRPLQRMSAGMILTMISFIMAGFLQMKIEANLESPLKETESGVTFYNTLHCDIDIKMKNLNHNLHIAPYQKSQYTVVEAESYEVEVTSCLQPFSTENLKLGPRVVNRIFFWSEDGKHVAFTKVKDIRSHPLEGKSKLSVFNGGGWQNASVVVVYNSYHREISNQSGILFPSSDQKGEPFHAIYPGQYNVYCQESSTKNWTKLNTSISVGQGAVYNLIIARNRTQVVLSLLTSVEVNSVSMAWMIPQYFVVTVGEVLFSITGLAFAYSQAPITMKSVVQAAWLMTTAFGSLVVIIVSQVQFFTSQVAEFMFFAVLMTVATLIFMTMSCCYTYYYTSGHGNDFDDLQELTIEEKNEDIPLKHSNHPKHK